jgi:hypothetical protein
MMSFSSAEALKAYNLNDLKKDYAGRLTVTTVDPSKFSDGNGIIFLPEDAAPTSLSNPGDASIYKLDGSKYLVKQETQEDSVVSAVLKQDINEQVGTIKKYNGNDDIDVAVSSGKPGQTIYVRYPNGLTAIIPAGGSFKQEGVVEAAMGKGVSKLASKTTFEPNFKGNLVVTTGFEPQKAMKAVDEYFENGMVTKVTDDLTHISTEDVDVLVLTAGFGTRIKDLTREVGEIKPTLGSPAEGEKFVHNALENATRAGLIDKDTKAQFLHDPEISGSASHLLLAYRSGLIKGDKPVLVLSSDHIHDIDFKKAIDFYKEKKNQISHLWQLFFLTL